MRVIETASRRSVRAYHLIRLLGIGFAVAGTLGRLLDGSMIELLPMSVRSISLEAWQAVTSWPVYAISLLLAGAWLQDWVDARLRSSEGRPSWFGVRALRSRLLFTSWILGRPTLYADEFKIRREIDRADTALVRAGFAPLAGLPLAADEDVGPTKEYVRSVRALVSAIGADRAAGASHALKQRLLPAPAVPPLASAGITNEASQPRGRKGRARTGILAWLTGRDTGA